jgi:hypothetical protein
MAMILAWPGDSGTGGLFFLELRFGLVGAGPLEAGADGVRDARGEALLTVEP